MKNITKSNSKNTKYNKEEKTVIILYAWNAAVSNSGNAKVIVLLPFSLMSWLIIFFTIHLLSLYSYTYLNCLTFAALVLCLCECGVFMYRIFRHLYNYESIFFHGGNKLVWTYCILVWCMCRYVWMMFFVKIVIILVVQCAPWNSNIKS